MRVTVNVFANLKDYYDSRFELELEGRASVSDVIDKIRSIKPEADYILSHSRYAVADNIVEKNFYLSDGAEVYIFPPSSGG